MKIPGSPRAKSIPAFVTCYVVAKEGADKARIENEIKTMPNYFADYDTTVHFISEEELQKNHSGIPHGGFVLRSGKSATDNKFLMEFSLKLDSNPEFTSSVLVAYARAQKRRGNRVRYCTQISFPAVGRGTEKTAPLKK